jgi:hypothetical protein
MGFPCRVPAFAAFVLAIATAGVFAQADAYPERTVSIIVSYAPGGVTDVLSRIIGRELATNGESPSSSKIARRQHADRGRRRQQGRPGRLHAADHHQLDHGDYRHDRSDRSDTHPIADQRTPP